MFPGRPFVSGNWNIFARWFLLIQYLKNTLKDYLLTLPERPLRLKDGLIRFWRSKVNICAASWTHRLLCVNVIKIRWHLASVVSSTTTSPFTSFSLFSCDFWSQVFVSLYFQLMNYLQILHRNQNYSQIIVGSVQCLTVDTIYIYIYIPLQERGNHKAPWRSKVTVSFHIQGSQHSGISGQC